MAYDFDGSQPPADPPVAGNPSPTTLLRPSTTEGRPSINTGLLLITRVLNLALFGVCCLLPARPERCAKSNHKAITPFWLSRLQRHDFVRGLSVVVQGAIGLTRCLHVAIKGTFEGHPNLKICSQQNRFYPSINSQFLIQEHVLHEPRFH